MKLRELKAEDASRMLEWMHDDVIVRYMGVDFFTKTMEDCQKFIERSLSDVENKHFAIIDNNDQYKGTVSLKHIDNINKCAEFAIVVCKEALGKGYSLYGMNEILRYGFEILGLSKIYWYVSKENERAINFYSKNGFQRITNVPSIFVDSYSEAQIQKFYWYMVENGEDVNFTENILNL